MVKPQWRKLVKDLGNEVKKLKTDYERGRFLAEIIDTLLLESDISLPTGFTVLEAVKLMKFIVVAEEVKKEEVWDHGA